MNRELRTFVVLSLHVLINGNTIYSVLRKIDETDAFKYSGDCFDICRQSGGYQTDSSCNCKCDIESAYSVTEKRCIEPNNQIDAFRLSNSRNPALFGVSTLSLYFLQSSGFAIFYCGDNNCRHASQCKINKPRSLYDNFGWERMWLPNETEDFSIETVANRQMLKLSRTSTRYRGMLLRINIDCTVDGNTVNAFAMFGVAGEFKEKERVESRFPQTTTTSTSMKTDSSTVSSTTVKGNTKSQNSTDKIFATGEDDGDSNAVGTALAILFVILFLIAVIIGLYLYYKWRQDKVAFVIKFNENRVVQYVQIKKSQIKQKLHHDKENMYDNPRDLYTDTQSQLSIDVLPDVVTVAERQSSPQVEKSHDNKFGTLRGLYATIDKFIRGKGKSSKKDQSFSAFPKELYNEPGVIFKIEKPKKPNRVNVKNIPFNKSKSVDEEQQERRPPNTRSRSASLPPVQQNLKGIKPRPISLILSSNINQGFDGNSELINSNFYMNTPVGSQNCLIYQNEDTISIEEVKSFPNNNNNRKRSSMALPESLHTINESAITERESDIIYKRPEEYIVMHPANNVPNKKPPSPSYAYADNIAKNRSVTDSKNEDPSSPPYAYAENVTKNQTVNGFENETPGSPPYANADNVQTGNFSDDEKPNSPSYAYADIVAQKDVDEESQGYNYPENVPQKQEDDSYLVPHPENEDEGEPFYETPSYACCNDIQNTSAKDNYGYEYERPSCDDPEYILPPHLSPPNSFSENIFSNIRMSIFRDSEYGTT